MGSEMCIRDRHDCQPFFSFSLIPNAIRRLLTGVSGNASDDQLTRHKSRRQDAVGGARRSTVQSGDGVAAKNRKRGKLRKKRLKSGGAFVSGEADILDRGSVLRKLAGGQPLLDDFNDANFEERKVGRNGGACMPSILDYHGHVRLKYFSALFLREYVLSHPSVPFSNFLSHRRKWRMFR